MIDGLRAILMILNKLRLLNLLLLSGMGVLVAKEVTQLPEYVITGSHVVRENIESFIPTTTLSMDDLKLQGAATPIEGLRSLPFFMGSTNNEYDSNGGTGSAGVNLRGLGNKSTLVLLNGRRSGGDSALGYQNGGFSDLNLLSLFALDSVDVARGGASAVYGSDAVAGVVNLKLKKNYIGSRLDMRYGNTAETDMGTRQLAFISGHQRGKTHVTLGANFYKRNALFARDRAISKNTDKRNLGGTNSGSTTFSGRMTHTPTGGRASNLVLNDGVTAPTSLADYRSLTADDRFNFAAYAPAIPEMEKKGMLLLLDHELTETLEFFSEAIFSNSVQANGLAPAPWSSSTNPALLSAARKSPHLPFATASELTWISYRSMELGNIENEYDKDAYRLLAGLRGDLNNDWEWESAYYYTDTETTVTRSGIADQNSLVPLIENGQFNIFANNYASGVIPSGTLAGQTYQNQAALEQARTTANIEYKEAMRNWDFHLRGDAFELETGMVKFSTGFEIRSEQLSYTPSAGYINQTLLSGTASTPYAAQREVQSVYAETLVPLIAEKSAYRYAKALDVNLALRLEQYSDTGLDPVTSKTSPNEYNSLNPKVTLRYKPSETLSFRASYGTAFRAPMLTEAYGAPAGDYPQLIDPSGYSTSGQPVFTRVNGNPELNPERARQWGLGVTFEPEYIDGLTLKLDYYSIIREDSISNGAQYMVDQNWKGQRAGFGAAGNFDPAAPFASKVNRSATTGALSWVDSSFFNVAEVRVEGLEFEVDYRKETQSTGIWAAQLGLHKALRYDVITAPGASPVSYKGRFQDYRSNSVSPGSIPDYKGYLQLSNQFRNWRTGARINYIDSLWDDTSKTLNNVRRKIASWTTLDISCSYDFTDSRYLKNTQIYAGINNVTNEPAPFAAGAFADGYDSSTHNLIGRYYSIGLTREW